MVSLPYGDTDLLDIISAVLQGHTFAPYLFILHLDYILQRSSDLIKENSLTWKKASR